MPINVTPHPTLKPSAENLNCFCQICWSTSYTSGSLNFQFRADFQRLCKQVLKGRDPPKCTSVVTHIHKSRISRKKCPQFCYILQKWLDDVYETIFQNLTLKKHVKGPFKLGSSTKRSNVWCIKKLLQRHSNLPLFFLSSRRVALVVEKASSSPPQSNGSS